MLDHVDEIAGQLKVGRTLREVADAVGLTESQVKSRIKSMRRILGEDDPDYIYPARRNNVEVGIAWTRRTAEAAGAGTAAD